MPMIKLYKHFNIVNSKEAFVVARQGGKVPFKTDVSFDFIIL